VRCIGIGGGRLRVASTVVTAGRIIWRQYSESSSFSSVGWLLRSNDVIISQCAGGKPESAAKSPGRSCRVSSLEIATEEMVPLVIVQSPYASLTCLRGITGFHRVQYRLSHIFSRNTKFSRFHLRSLLLQSLWCVFFRLTHESGLCFVYLDTVVRPRPTVNSLEN